MDIGAMMGGLGGLGGAVGTAGAARATEIAKAIKASGAIVRVEPADFQAILARVESAPLVVTTQSKVFWKVTYKYLTAYKGLTFYAASPTPIELPSDAQIVRAKNIWIPG